MHSATGPPSPLPVEAAARPAAPLFQHPQSRALELLRRRGRIFGLEYDFGIRITELSSPETGRSRERSTGGRVL
jgi:hypothetical protein